MKKFNFLLLTLLASFFVLGISSCNDSDDDGVSLELSTYEITFPSAGGTRDVDVTSNEKWTYDSNDKTWFRVSDSNGKIIIEADQNTGNERKTTTITVRSGSRVKTVDVTQGTAADDDTLEVNTTAIDFDYNDTREVGREVKTSADEWDAVPSENWIVVKKADSQFTVSVKENTDATTRSGRVTVSAGTATPKIIMIYQGKTPGAGQQYEGIYSAKGTGFYFGEIEWSSPITWNEDVDPEGKPDHYFYIENFGDTGEAIFANLDSGNILLDYTNHVTKLPYAILMSVAYIFYEEELNTETGEMEEIEYFGILSSEGAENYRRIDYDPETRTFTTRKYTYTPPGSGETYDLYYVQVAYNYFTYEYFDTWSDLFSEFTMRWVSENTDSRAAESDSHKRNYVEIPSTRKFNQIKIKEIAFDKSGLKVKE